MGCTSDLILAGITYDCSDIPVGGLKKIIIARLDKTTITESDENTITAIAFDVGDEAVELEFNNKDGVSNFTDVKTVEASGSVSVVPTITVEFPKMTKAKRDELNALTQAGLELVAFIETAAGTMHCVGSDFGLFGQSASGASGAARADKNAYTFVLTGEESDLALDIDATVWASILAVL